MNCIKIQFADFTKIDQKIKKEAGVSTENRSQRKKNLQSHKIAFIIHINNFKTSITACNILSYIKAIKFHRALLARPRGQGCSRFMFGFFTAALWCRWCVIFVRCGQTVQRQKQKRAQGTRAAAAVYLCAGALKEEETKSCK